MAPARRSLNHRGQIAVVAVALGVAFALLAAATPASASAQPSPAPRGELGPLTPTSQLVTTILGEAGVRPKQLRERIVGIARTADALFVAGRICDAADRIAVITRLSRQIKPAEAKRLIFAAAWEARASILGSQSRRSPCFDRRVGREPVVKLRHSTKWRLSAHVRLGAAELNAVQQRRRRFTELGLPGLNEDVDAIGRPSLPVLRELIAIPRGARVRVTANAHGAQVLPAVPVPVQAEAPMGPIDEYHGDEPPPPELFAEPPFAFNRRAYRGRGPEPAGKACHVDPIGLFREVRIGVVECAVARYLPQSDKVTVFSSLDFAVSFTGGKGYFAPRRGGNPFQGKGTIQKTAPINDSAVASYSGPADLVAKACTGEELMILTHAELRGPADEMADWKNSIGIPTHVFTVNDGAGSGPDTVDEIRQLIRKRYKTCSVKPSYVMLFGDAEWVPTDYLPKPSDPTAGYIATDWSYTQLAPPPGLVGPSPLGWQFAVGRIPVDPAQAEAVVDKLTGYEQNPPNSPFEDFYGQAGIASQFDCCNLDEDPDTGNPLKPDGTDKGWFIGTVEDLRDGLQGEGYDVDRIYQRTVSGSYTGNPTPFYYNNGTTLPSDLLPPFAWDGSGAKVVDAFNDGRSIMIHLDHGWSGGWSTPNFDKNAAAGLTNGDELAFVLSYNCSSGYFDNETDGPGNDPNATSDPTGPSFKNWAEEIIRNPNGGAMGTIAATRTTYGHGNIMMRGALDAAFPDIDPDWGGDFPNRRIGDMLNQARLYMAAQYGAGTTTRLHWYLYNLHGDPTAELWTEIPFEIRIPTLVDRRPDFLHIEDPVNGIVLTAWQQTDSGPRAIGRATVRDGEANLNYFIEPLAGVPIKISADADNGIGAVVAEVGSG